MYFLEETEEGSHEREGIVRLLEAGYASVKLALSLMNGHHHPDFDKAVIQDEVQEQLLKEAGFHMDWIEHQDREKLLALPFLRWLSLPLNFYQQHSIGMLNKNMLFIILKHAEYLFNTTKIREIKLIGIYAETAYLFGLESKQFMNIAINGTTSVVLTKWI